MGSSTRAYALISQRPVQHKYAPASAETGTYTKVALVTAYVHGEGTTSGCCEAVRLAMRVG